MARKKSVLYSSLRSSCDELRGGMGASRYKHHVPVLLLIEYVSDKYAGVACAPIAIPAGARLTDMVALKGILCDMNTEIAARAAQLTKTHQLKQGMMAGPVAGRTRLA